MQISDECDWRAHCQGSCPFRVSDEGGEPVGCRGLGRTRHGGLAFLQRWCQSGRWWACPAFHWHRGVSSVPPLPDPPSD